MTTNYTGTSGGAFTNNLTGPAAGEFVTAASVGLVAQSAANQDKQLQEGIGIGLELAYNMWFSDGLIVGGGGPTSIDAGKGAGIILDCLPHAGKVQTFKVRLAPAAHVSLPGTMPKLTLYKFALTGGVTMLGTQTDTSASAAIYSAAHDLTLDLGSPLTLDRTTFTYLLSFDQEDGVNSATGSIGPARIAVS